MCCSSCLRSEAFCYALVFISDSMPEALKKFRSLLIRHDSIQAAPKPTMKPKVSKVYYSKFRCNTFVTVFSRCVRFKSMLQSFIRIEDFLYSKTTVLKKSEDREELGSSRYCPGSVKEEVRPSCKFQDSRQRGRIKILAWRCNIIRGYIRPL